MGRRTCCVQLCDIPGKQNIVADTLSRNPDYDTGLKIVETKILKEENGKLLLNQQARIAIVQVSCEDQKLLEEIEKKAGDGRMEKFNGLIKVPKSMESQILKRYHDDIREGHPGLARMMEKVQRNFYIPGLTRKVKNYIKRCDECQRNKHDNSKPLGKMITEKDTPKRPWQHVAMDLMSMPAKEKGKQLLVIADKFSKMTILAITSINATAEEIYQIVWGKVFSVFGIPESIISDLDKIFRSQRWRE